MLIHENTHSDDKQCKRNSNICEVEPLYLVSHEDEQINTFILISNPDLALKSVVSHSGLCQ